MRLMQIRYFLATAELNSITKAAEKLYISQPALSKQLSLLESELGVRLFHRLTRGIELTEAGALFAADCRKIIADLDTAVSRVMIYGGTRKKELRLGCFDGAVIDDFMPALYAHFHRISPDLNIRLSRRSMEENRISLKAGQIDLAIELRFPLSEYNDEKNGYISKALLRRKGALIYSARSALANRKDLTIQDFADETFLVSTKKEDQDLTSHSLKTLAALGLRNPPTEPVDNLMSALSTIKLGHGYYLLAKAVADYDPQLRAFDLPEEYETIVTAFWRRDNTLITSLMDSFSFKESGQSSDTDSSR